MKEKHYDENDVLSAYLIRFAQRFMTDFEKRCVLAGIIREKMRAAEHRNSDEFAATLREKYEAIATPEIAAALVDGVGEYQQQIQRRLRHEYDEGALQVNRCPQCSRIVRTPLAQQCMWCSHDWHE